MMEELNIGKAKRPDGISGLTLKVCRKQLTQPVFDIINSSLKTGRDEEITVAFQAHNPGKWMFHCHMLEHQDGGMATWYEVA